MTDPAFKAVGATSSYGGTIAKPAGSGACQLILQVSWFYGGKSVPTAPSGWTLVDWVTDNRTTDACTTGVFRKTTSDLSAEASTVTFTPPSGGGDHLGIMSAWDNVDTTTPVSASSTQAAQASTTVSLSASVGTSGSMGVVCAGDYDFNQWKQSVPSGWTRDAGNPAGDTGSEVGLYHIASQSAGTLTFTLGTNVGRFAIVMLILTPSGGAAATHGAESAARRQMRYNPIYSMAPRPRARRNPNAHLSPTTRFDRLYCRDRSRRNQPQHFADAQASADSTRSEHRAR